MFKVLLSIGVFCFQITSLQSQTSLSDSTKLQEHRVFKNIRISVPATAIRDEKSAEALERLGGAHFASQDDAVEIDLREREGPVPLTLVKSTTDDIAQGFGVEILKSEIIRVDGMDIFYSDGRGPWNGEGEPIGIFRIYFNVKKKHYSMVMKYPALAVDQTKKLKESMINSIRTK